MAHPFKVSVAGRTYRRLRAFAQRQGVSMSQIVAAIAEHPEPPEQFTWRGVVRPNRPLTRADVLRTDTDSVRHRATYAERRRLGLCERCKASSLRKAACLACRRKRVRS